MQTGIHRRNLWKENWAPACTLCTNKWSSAPEKCFAFWCHNCRSMYLAFLMTQSGDPGWSMEFWFEMDYCILLRTCIHNLTLIVANSWQQNWNFDEVFLKYFQLLAKLLKSKDPNDLQAANRLIKNMVKQVRHIFRFYYILSHARKVMITSW